VYRETGRKETRGVISFFVITGNADTIYNIRNRNEMTDRNRKLSGNTANLPNRKEINNNRKGVRYPKKS
jgi:hypothetical protein